MKFKELLQQTNQILEDLGMEYFEDGRVQGLFTERTARFFRQAGVLSAPEGQGSGAQWNELHVMQLVATRVLQFQGKGVQEVGTIINGKTIRQLKNLIEQNRTQKIDEPEEKIPVTNAWDLGGGFHLLSTEKKPLPQKTLKALQRILSDYQ